MKNFREVNDDILKEWLEFREENILCYLNAEDNVNVKIKLIEKFKIKLIEFYQFF